MTHKIWLIIVIDHFFGSFRAGSTALRLSISSFRFFFSSSFILVYKNSMEIRSVVREILRVGFGICVILLLSTEFQTAPLVTQCYVKSYCPKVNTTARMTRNTRKISFSAEELLIINPVLYRLLVEHSAHHHLALSTMHCTNKNVMMKIK